MVAAAESLTAETIPPTLAFTRLELEREVVEGCRASAARIGAATLTRLGITSTMPGEGRSTIALGMASLVARDHCRRTLLIELDSEQPTLCDRVGLGQVAGLADLINGEAALDHCLHPLDQDLFLLPAGDPSALPERGAAANAQDVINIVEQRFDVIVADLPILAGSGAGLLMAELFPTLMLVVRAGVTPLSRVRGAVANLSTPPVVLLNGTTTALPSWVRRIVGDPT